MGFQRNLSVWEIVEQFLWAGWAARKFSSKPEVVDAFIAKVRNAGIFVTHRKTLGQSIQAACGQLVTRSHLPSQSYMVQ